MSYIKSGIDKKGWKDIGFSVGSEILCISNIEKVNPNSDFWTDKLTIGKYYKITELEWRFWDRVCIKNDYGLEIFVPVEFFFDETIEKRNNKIENILKK